MEALSFRVDVSAASGMGHGMRCLALAQAWRDRGGHVVFLMAESLPAFDVRLKEEGVDVVRIRNRPGSGDDAREAAEAAQSTSCGWVIVDGYHFDGSYQDALKAAGLSVLAIDDYGHAGKYSADVVLNQNLHAKDSLYRHREPSTRLLLGPRYALLRREFRKHARPQRADRSQVECILVTLGGADRNHVAEVVLRGLAKVVGETYRVTVVVGRDHESGEGLKALARDLKLTARFEHDVRDMPGIMARADIAIAAGGTTAWELAYMGVPSLLVIVADNQREVVESLEGAGIAANLGYPRELNADRVAKAIQSLVDHPIRRTVMAERGRKLVDGGGAERVLRELSLPQLALRPAREEDLRRIWEWSNEPATRAASFSGDSIPWEDHVKWFHGKLADPRCRLYIAADPTGREMGQIRFDFEGAEAEVSVSLDPEVRGRGYGAALIRLASQKLFAESDIRTIHAYAKEANEASVRAFLDAGYEDRGVTVIRGHRALHFVSAIEVHS